MAETQHQSPEQQEAQSRQRFEERGPIGQTLQCFGGQDAKQCWKQVGEFWFGKGMAGDAGRGIDSQNKNTEKTARELEK